MIRRDPREAARRLALRFNETMKILSGVDMTQPNVHELINLKGAGNAEKELRKSGNWDRSDMEATPENPILINIKCTGYSVVEDDNILTIYAH